MTNFLVRTDPQQAVGTAEVLLDWFGGDPAAASTVKCNTEFFTGLETSPVALDLFRLGAAVYCVDKIMPRANTADAWTRELELAVPVSDPILWTQAAPLLMRTLGFLTGDRWNVTFQADSVERPEAQHQLSAAADAVSLFSGGLDSLCGVIELLEQGHQLVLVGHHDSPLPDSKQVALFEQLRTEYGTDRLALRRLFLRPAPPNTVQLRPLPGGDGENTTRSRSFLFIAAGVAVADGLGAALPLYMPENGFIGINVPLTAARVSSLSTRTTHPLYMAWMAQLLQAVGLTHAVINPYRLLTKGEALESNSNLALVKRLAPASVSCSHPEVGRWKKLDQGNCGYCYPCLIRRASLHRVGEDRASDYTYDALTDAALLQRHWGSGSSLRSLAQSLARPDRRTDVLRNGRIPNRETANFFDVYRRGREELREWLAAGAGNELRRRLGP